MRGGKRSGAGRPKGAKGKTAPEIKALAREHGEEAINTLVDLMRNAESEMVRERAAMDLLDRGIGKPVQEITGGDGGPIVVQVVNFAANPSSP